MHAHHRLFHGLFLWAVILAPPIAEAQEPIVPRQISYDQLAALGDAIDAREMMKDNVFLYQESSEQIRQRAKALPGASISFTVAVTRVTGHEVFLFVPDARDTRVTPMHEQPPVFGNLRSVIYGGSLSTRVAQILSRPFALRIGSEIELQVAKGLRRGDLLVLNGKLETLHLLLDHVFQPRAIAVISQVEVSEVNPRDASKEYFYR